MRLSTLAVAVSLALGASLMTACDRGADRNPRSSFVRRTAPSGATTHPALRASGSASSSGTTRCAPAPSGSSSSSTSIDLHEEGPGERRFARPRAPAASRQLRRWRDRRRLRRAPRRPRLRPARLSSSSSSSTSRFGQVDKPIDDEVTRSTRKKPPESAGGLFISGHCDGHRADALDRGDHRVAGLHRAHALRRAGKDHVAGMERVEGAAPFDRAAPPRGSDRWCARPAAPAPFTVISSASCAGSGISSRVTSQGPSTQ